MNAAPDYNGTVALLINLALGHDDRDVELGHAVAAFANGIGAVLASYDPDDAGEARFRIDHTYNIDCRPLGCPDTITVTAVPDGVGVDVDVIDAAEESWTAITVYDPDILPQG
jgi:hypothetical protein